MVNFELREAVLSEKEKKELETARTLPITYDEDSPELDETMEQAFRQARRKKPYSGKPLTVCMFLPRRWKRQSPWEMTTKPSWGGCWTRR